MADRDIVRARDTDRRVPLTFRWFAGRSQPAVNQQEVVWWEDENNQTAKILMRRSRKTYVFEATTPQEAGEPAPDEVVTLGGLDAERGALIYGNATPAWIVLPLGSTGTVLFSDGTDLGWASLSTAGIASSALTLTAGAGLTGGGDLTINRTFAVGAGTGITVNADDVALTVPVTIALGGTNSIAALSGSSIMVSNGSAIVQGSAGTATTVLHGNASGVPTYAAVSLTADVTGALALANGGTGLTAWSQGDLPYFTSGTALSQLAKDANATRYLSNQGVSNAPSWNQVNLVNGVTGILPLTNGGTGADLSATGGTSQYVKQASVGGAFTVGTIAAADLPGSFAGFAIPSVDVDVIAEAEGSAATAIRSDARLQLSQAIVPTWTGLHTFNPSTSPAEAVLLDLATPGAPSLLDSHWIRWVGAGLDSGFNEYVDWRAYARFVDSNPTGAWVLQTRQDPGTGYTAWADAFVLDQGGVISTAHTFTGTVSMDNVVSLNSGTGGFSATSNTGATGYGFTFNHVGTGTGGIVKFSRSGTASATLDNTGLLKVLDGTAGLQRVCVRTNSDAGVTLGLTGMTNSGRLDSYTTDGVGVVQFLLKPSVGLTSGVDRYVLQVQDQAGVVGLTWHSNGVWQFGGAGVSGGYVNVSGTFAISGVAQGINFIPTIQSAGAAITGVSGNTIIAGYFSGRDNTSGANVSVVGGYFEAAPTVSGKVRTDMWGAVCRVSSPGGASSSETTVGCFKTTPFTRGAMGTVPTNVYGGYISGHTTSGTNRYGLYLEEHSGGTINNGIFLASATAAYKAIAIRDQNAYISSSAAATLDLTGTTINLNGSVQVISELNSVSFEDTEVFYEDSEVFYS